jgi:hypothetical protein
VKILKLKPVKITKNIVSRLEKRGLITTMKFTRKALKAAGKRGKVDLIYSTEPKFGPQKLICVGKRDLEIEMSVHGDKEELLMLNTTALKFKPLYLIIAMDKLDVFKKKVDGGRLAVKDIMAIELKYNDPALSIFVMNAGVPHCEVTLPGRGQHPLFFVTEPAALSFALIPTPGYKLELA